MIGTTTSRISVNGVELAVHTAGDPANPALLLCHGFPESAYSWRHQMQPFADDGWFVIAPDQRGYATSSVPRDVAAYGIEQLTGDLTALVDHFGKSDAVWVGHDWGAIIVWEAAKLHASRIRAVCGVSVPFVHWPGPPTQLMRMVYGDRFFYILYFQQVGPPEAELDANPEHTMSRVLFGASGTAMAGRDPAAAFDLPPMDGTGFLAQMPDVPPLPFTGPEGPWLTADDLARYTAEFTASGFFGPVSYYRNLDANFEITGAKSAADVTMPSYFIGGSLDPVNLIDPGGVQRMVDTLPNFCGHTMIDGAGHWIQQEAPQAFNDALRGFLRQL